MTQGIIVFGASGSGTTTIGKALADALGCKHLEADDYLWESTCVPYTVMRSVEERSRLLHEDLKLIDSSYFVLSGSICGWDASIKQSFHLAVFVLTPTEVRLTRIRERELSRWGQRILPGGDMYRNHLAFLEWASVYDTGGVDVRSRALHESWGKELPCPVVQVDGTLSVTTVVESVIKKVKVKAELPLT